MAQRHSLRTFAATCWAVLACSLALAGEFSVSPVRMELGAAAKSGVFTISNEGNEKLSFQIQAKAWSQDAEGKDQYQDTTDLIFFPKITSVDAGQQGIVRVGLKAAPDTTEKTYRLFIEELPGIRKEAQANQAQITFLIRFGAPIFATPPQPQDGLAIEGLELKKGVVAFSVKNTGNRHQVIQGVHLKGMDAAGKAVYTLDIADRYLLAGAQKPYTSIIAAEQCQRIAVLQVDLKTDKQSAMHKLDIHRAMCP